MARRLAEAMLGPGGDRLDDTVLAAIVALDGGPPVPPGAIDAALASLTGGSIPLRVTPEALTRPPGVGVNVGAAPIGPRYEGTLGQSAGSGYSPIADRLAAFGVNRDPGMLQDLAMRAAPMVDQVERGARGFLGAAGEATGLPSAGRAGEALAEGDYPRAAGNALLALPSRLTAILGAPLSSAEAQAPDPRLKRVRDLEGEIKAREKRLQGYGNRSFPSARARADAVKVEEDGIAAARRGATALQDAMDAETAQAAAAERARLASAEWANTPTARAYPGAQPLATGAGLATGVATTFTRARGAVGAYNRRMAELDTSIAAAVDRARNSRLTPQARTAAAAEARAAQEEFNRLAGAAPHPSRLGAAGLGFAATELGTGSIPLIDYLSSVPGSSLRAETLHANDPVNNPGEMAARYLIPGAIGAGLGELGGEFGSRGVVRPTGHAAAVQSLNKRYTRRSR